VKSSGMQTAIWEIVYETGDTYDIMMRVFNVNAGNTTVNLARLLAGTWLDRLPGPTATAPMIVLSSPHRQDFITVVPDAPSLALFAGGLLFGRWSVRRKQQA